MNLITLISALVLSTSINAQWRPDNEEDTLFGRYLDPSNRSREYRDATGFYYKIPPDTNVTTFISNGYNIFRLIDKGNRVLVEGDLGGRIYTDYFKKFGKWTAFYPNGKTKWTGYYYAGVATGLWNYFYPNGQLKKTFTLAPIEVDSFFLNRKVGLYEEYYENGKIKTSGFFKIAIDTAIIQVYDFNVGNFKDSLVLAQVSKQFGIWKHYKETGELERKEEHY